ncbi:MAG: hypothetical protein H7Y04_00715 [Verrucomicrobia bacterium]|nr:hypothetical protein [Cytophagales bacterium]
MKIVFLTGCTEPGQDGLGDYTMILARECILAGHSVTIVALHDSFVETVVSENRDMQIKVLRVPSDYSFAKKTPVVQALIQDFSPDWLSFQFVGYSFHSRGIPIGLISFLKKISGKYSLQIMLHELWIGSKRSDNLKNKIIGFLQRKYVLQMLAVLRPQVIHTSMRTNQSALEHHGYQAKILSIFSNIPIATNPEMTWLYQAVQNETDIDIRDEKRKDFIIFGIFGSIYSDWNAEDFFFWLKKYFYDKKILLISAGKLAGAGEILWENLKKKHPSIHFIKLGKRSEEEISTFLQWIDFGVATTPAPFIPKSGTFAAMIEHGLQVIATNQDFDLPEYLDLCIPTDKQLYVISEEKNFVENNKMSPKSRNEQIVQQFLVDLSV